MDTLPSEADAVGSEVTVIGGECAPRGWGEGSGGVSRKTAELESGLCSAFSLPHLSPKNL